MAQAPAVGTSGQAHGGGEPQQGGTISSVYQGLNSINLKTYAVGDGTVDDAPNIARAIVAAQAAGGAEIVAPPGIYRCNSAVSWPNFITMRGMGQSTIFRAGTTSNFIFNLNPANRVRFSNFQVDALSTQASGGGWDYSNAVQNVNIDYIYHGNGLFRVYSVTPTVTGGGIYTWEMCRTYGSSNMDTVWYVAPAAGVTTTELHLLRCINTCGSNITNWVKLDTGASGAMDTFRMIGAEFYRGTNGFVTAGTNNITGLKLESAIFDTCSGIGVSLLNVTDTTIVGGALNTCGTGSANAHMQIGAAAKGVSVIGTTIQNGLFTGIDVAAGASYVTIMGAKITDNNTSNSANGDGIRIGANNLDFAIAFNTVGNNILLATGHQKTGINVLAGTSDRYYLGPNIVEANESAQVVDGGTGTNKFTVSRVGAVTQGALILTQAAAAGAAGLVSFGNTITTTIGAAGGAAALPATPLGYIGITEAGVAAKIPFYNP